MIAGPLGAELQNDPTYGGVRIIPQGIEVDVVGGGSGALEGAIARAEKTVPVRTKAVGHSWEALQALTSKLNRDQPKWRAKDVFLSAWGPDVSSNRVEIWLAKYNAAAAAALKATYGVDWVAVSPKSQSNSAS